MPARRTKPSAARPAPPERPKPPERPAPRDRPALRGKLWLEAAGRPVLTEATADLLDQIDACGSVSAAARNLRFAYRRAWLLIDAVNRAWAEPLVVKVTGGPGGGGAKLTDFGRHVLRAYRDLQLQLEHLLDVAGDPFAAGRSATSDRPV
jgi:molybdate transport system regulatory protein